MQVELDLPANGQDGLRAARWYLLRATEALAFGRYEQARQDLDEAFQVMAELEDDAMPESTRALQEALQDPIVHMAHIGGGSQSVQRGHQEPERV